MHYLKKKEITSAPLKGCDVKGAWVCRVTPCKRLFRRLQKSRAAWATVHDKEVICDRRSDLTFADFIRFNDITHQHTFLEHPDRWRSTFPLFVNLLKGRG